MGKMRITGKCHFEGCKNKIDEGMARLCGSYWFYCNKHALECDREKARRVNKK